MSRKGFKRVLCGQYEKDWILLILVLVNDTVAVNDIKDIHNFLIEKNSIWEKPQYK